MTGTWSGYYYFDDFSSLDPYGASSFPTGFGSDNRNRNQLGTLSNTHVFSPTAVNDFRLGYIRIVVRNVPAGSEAPALAALGFVTGAGTFGFSGGDTGYAVADYLLGAPTSYSQSSPQVLDGRSRYGGIYAQDSIRLRSNLTLNLGLRWEYSTPWYDTQNKIVALVPGLQST